MMYENNLSAIVVNIDNVVGSTIPDIISGIVVDVNAVNLLKARLDRFWANKDVKYDFTADLYEICET